MASYMLGNATAARFAPLFGSLQLLLVGRAIAFAAAVAMALWAGSAPLSVWLLFVPIGLAEIGDGMSGPAVMAAALSIHPRLAGTASGLMGFLQMAAAALGSFVVALLSYQNAFGMIALYGGFVALGLSAAIFAVRRAQPPAAAATGERPVLPGAPASAMGRCQVPRGQARLGTSSPPAPEPDDQRIQSSSGVSWWQCPGRNTSQNPPKSSS
jgi:MFS family permease